jgi:uncharacterized protein (DUF427 family)
MNYSTPKTSSKTYGKWCSVARYWSLRVAAETTANNGKTYGLPNGSDKISYQNQ